SDPDSDADEPAEAGQDDGFDENLLADGTVGGAVLRAAADLAGSFGDRGQHDIQDADTTDDQQDYRDGRGEQDDDVHDLVERLQPVSQGLNLEVPQQRVTDVMAGIEDAGDLVYGGGHGGLLGGLHGDLVERVAGTHAWADYVAAVGFQWHDRGV